MSTDEGDLRYNTCEAAPCIIKDQKEGDSREVSDNGNFALPERSPIFTNGKITLPKKSFFDLVATTIYVLLDDLTPRSSLMEAFSVEMKKLEDSLGKKLESSLFIKYKLH